MDFENSKIIQIWLTLQWYVSTPPSQYCSILHAEYSSWSYYPIIFAKVHPSPRKSMFHFIHTQMHLWICVPIFFLHKYFLNIAPVGAGPNNFGQFQNDFFWLLTSDFWLLTFAFLPMSKWPPKNSISPKWFWT